MKAKFMICRHCGNLVEVTHDAGVPMMCCGQELEELIPNTVEASSEKHIPVVEVSDGLVKVHVGSAAHPMQDVHFIQWIALETEHGIQRKHLQPGEEPSAVFALGTETPKAVYAYCNLHGLWKTDL